MSKKLKFCLFVCCVFFHLSAISQFKFQQVTTENGLANNTVLSITEDNYGRIWFATYDGLSFFDGFEYHSVRPFQSVNEERVAFGSALKLLVDFEGNVWTLYENGQLIRILNDNGRSEFFNCLFDEKVTVSNINLSVDNELVAKINGAYYKYDSKNSKLHAIDSIKFQERRSDKEIRKEFKTIYPKAEIYSVYFPKNDKDIWISTVNMGVFYIPKGDLSRFNNYSLNSQDPYKISNDEVYCVYKDSNGNIWLGTKNTGLNVSFVNNFKVNVCQINNIGNERFNPTVRAILYEENGTTWLGTYNKGIVVKIGEKYHQIRLSGDGRSDKWDWVRSIYQGKDQYIWVGTYAGLCRIHPKSHRIKYWSVGRSNTLPSTGRIYSIVEDGNENLYLGEWGALEYFDRSKNSFTRIDSTIGIANRNIRKLYLQNDRFLWIGTETQGVFVLDKRSNKIIRNFRQTDSESGINSNSIFDIYGNKEGDVWIGTFGGLNCINKEGKLKEYNFLDMNLPSNLIYRIYEDDSNHVWCTSPKGIVKLNRNTNKVRFYDSDDIGCIYEFVEGAGFQDSKGRLYFGGCNGIVSFHPDSIQSSYIVPKPMIESLLVNGNPYDKTLINRDSNMIFSFWENDISIDLKAIQINSPQKNKLAWQLEPKENSFKIFNGPATRVSYQNLPHGKYKLLVRSANADGVWSEEQQMISFVIEKPIWLELYFIIACAIFIILSVVVLGRVRLCQIKRKNDKLELTVRKRTLKIERQKQKLNKANKSLEEKNAEISAQRDQILAQRDHLLEVHDKLERANDLKQKFFTNISHDIRTPLTLIKAPLFDMLKDSNVPEDLLMNLKLIERNTNYVLKLVNQVLDVKKIELGGLEPVYTYGDIVDVCRKLVQNFNQQAITKDLNLYFLSEQKKFQCRFDFDKLQQILYNLIANAIKFTAVGGRIQCELKLNENGFSLKVTDDGIGIPEDRIPYIFDRYYQVGKSNESDNQGTGIGLSLVSDFVKVLNGTIDVISNAGIGSSFVLNFPFTVNETIEIQDKISNHTSEEPDINVESKNDINILIVENNEELRHYLYKLLSRKYNVTLLENGKQAIKYLSKNKNIALILSDWMMPEMDGVELCKAIKKKHKLRNIPFVILTALTSNENQKEAYKVGIDEFIKKPFNPDLLIVKIHSLLQRNNQIKEAANTDAMTLPENKKVVTYDEKIFAKLKQMMEKNLSDSNFGQNELASELGMSSMQLYRKLKGMTKMSPNEFIRSFRINRSKQLLASKGITINEISDMVGFNDPKYFSRCFTKEVGQSPTKFRSELLNVVQN